ncbi:MAG: transglycosylase domain-containing protein, partial [Anaerolineales bacterium]
RTRVLEWFLNSAYFGHLAYGADSAAQLYLGKPASQLTLAEAAQLLAAYEAPALNPLDAPIAARERRRFVLEHLLAVGAINRQEFEQAVQTQLIFRQLVKEEEQIGRAFVRLALEQAAKQMGRRRVERGGLRIVTTLDLDLQRQLKCTVKIQLRRLSGQSDDLREDCPAGRLLPTLSSDSRSYPADLRAGAVLLDVESGQVLALLGETTPQDEKAFLPAGQPGSLLTPFVALAGFTRGMSPASLVWDIPARLPQSLQGRQNPDGKFHGPQRLRLALANDYLVPFTDLLVQLGASNVWHLVEPFGLSGLVASPQAEDLLFDGGNISILNIAQAYQVFAGQGVLVGQRTGQDGTFEPLLVLVIEDFGGHRWLDATQPGATQKQAVVSAQLAYLVNHVLSDENARRISLGYPNPLEIGRPTGAKLGQTADGSQVWTVGYTPQRLLAIWIGLPADADVPIRLSPKLAASVWRAVMQYATRDLPPIGWSEPPGMVQVTVCDPSGKLPTSACPSRVNEVFIQGNEPTEADALYQVYQVNRETGRLATVFTPLEMIDERTYLVLPEEALDWAKQNNIPIPPTEYDTIQPAPCSPAACITSPASFTFVKGMVTVRGTAAGEDFAFYRLQIGRGLNPRTWLQLGEDSATPVTEDVLGEWNTRDQDGLYALRLTVVKQNQQVLTSVVQVTVDNTPPEARIAFPLDGQVVQRVEDRPLVLQCDVNDAFGIRRVEWLLDGKVIAESNLAPYSALWQAETGEHELRLRAYDLADNVGESQPVRFRVQ